MRVDHASRRCAAGLETDSYRGSGRRLACEMRDRAEPSLGFEKIDGKVAVGVKPVQLEPATRRLAVIGTVPRVPRCRAWRKCSPADDPGILGGQTVRPDDTAGDGRAAAKHDANVQAGTAQLGIAGAEPVGINASGRRACQRRSQERRSRG